MERRNWAENVVFTPGETVTPTSVEEVSAVVQRAERQRLQVRVIGSGWSFSDVMRTDGVLVDMSALSGVLGLSQGRRVFRDQSRILTEALREEVLGSSRRLAHVGAGITIRGLYQVLDKDDGHPGDRERDPWALFTMGGAGGQTLAGVIATGTHGANFSLPPIADWVRAIHLIGPGGVQHWIEPAGDRRITDLERMRSMPGLRRENVHYDDDWFNAAILSVGCLGIIVSLVVEVRNQYGLSQRVVQTRWRALRPLLETPAAFESGIFSPTFPLGIRHPTSAAGRRVTPEASSVEIFLNPYRISDDYHRDGRPDRHCLLVSKAEARPADRADGAFDRPPVSPSDHFHGFWNGLGNALRDAGTVIRVESGGPGTVKDEINGIMTRSRADTVGYPVSWRVLDTYDYGGSKPPVMSMELAVSTRNNAHLALIERLLEISDEMIRRGGKFIGAMSLRFTLPSRAGLAMQHHDAVGRDRICHIELFGLKELNALGGVTHDGNMEGGTDAFMLAFENAAHEAGARLHWGQLHLLDRARVERAYPKTLHGWRRVRTELAAPGRSHTFSSWFSRRCGLEAYTEGLAATSWGPGRYDVFGFNERGDVRQLWWNGAWHWSDLGNGFPGGDRFTGPLTAASWGNDRIDVFGLGKRGNMLQLWWDGAWHWSDLGNGFAGGGRFLGPLTATSWGEGRYDVFGLDESGNVRQLWFDRRWRWDNLGNGFAGGQRFFGPLAAASWGNNRIDVFGLGPHGNVLQLWWDGAWHWSDLGNGFPGGERFTGPLTAVSWGPNRIDVFGPGRSGNVLQLWWDGAWHWDDLGNAFTGEVRGRCGPPHEFGASVGEPYQLWRRERTRDRFAGVVTAASWGEGRIDVFGFGETGHVLQLWFDRGWHWSDLGNGWR